MGKDEPLSSQSFLQVFDNADAQFKVSGEGLRFGNAFAIKLEQGYQLPFFGQENFKPELELMVFDQGFLPY